MNQKINKKKIKVLVVDDSFLMRKIISDFLNEDSGIQVVGTAVDGVDAIEKIRTLMPDVVTLDIHMPRMDGKEVLKHVMKLRPIPVVMLSAYTSESANITLECLELGAVDFLQKPSGEISVDIETIKGILIQKIYAASQSKVNFRKGRKPDSFLSKSFKDVLQDLNLANKKIIVIGASTGGPPVLEEIFSKVTPFIDIPIVIAQHMPTLFIENFLERLSSVCDAKISPAKKGETLKPGTIYVIPGDCNTYLKSSSTDNTVVFDYQKDFEEDQLIFPSIDKLFLSAARIYKDKTLGIILSGMGEDGVKGALLIKNYGGINIVQDEKSAVVYGMPQAALNKGCVQNILSPFDIANLINTFSVYE
jgi:two-component system chemotaxis response regulator CheB